MRSSSSLINMLKRSAGFTLLELLVVVGILSSMAYLAADALTEDDGQRRFEDTKNRLKTIKRAIIGTPDRIVNDRPQINGFVADVGRLPRCLQELTERDADCDNDGSIDNNISALSSYNPDSETYNGWNGPYLPVMRQIVGDLVFRDGWGNPVSGTTIRDYGWVVQHEKKNGTTVTNAQAVAVANRDSTDQEVISVRRGMHVASFGRDSIQNSGSGLLDFEADYPRYEPNTYPQDMQLIAQKDHHFDLEGVEVKVRLENQEASGSAALGQPEDFCLQITYPKNGYRIVTEDIAGTDIDRVYGFPIDLDQSPSGDSLPTTLDPSEIQNLSFEMTCPDEDVSNPQEYQCGSSDTKVVLIPWGQRALRFGKYYDVEGKTYCSDLNRKPADLQDELGADLPLAERIEIAQTAHTYPIQFIPGSTFRIPEVQVTWDGTEWTVEFE